jgi:hypothetical protein
MTDFAFCDIAMTLFRRRVTLFGFHVTVRVTL